MEDDYRYITLRCRHCGNMDCELYPIGSYIVEDEGCTRRVDDTEAEQWDHITKEVVPFLILQKNPDVEPIEDFFAAIYQKPIGQKLDKYGKVVIKK